MDGWTGLLQHVTLPGLRCLWLQARFHVETDTGAPGRGRLGRGGGQCDAMQCDAMLRSPPSHYSPRGRAARGSGGRIDGPRTAASMAIYWSVLTRLHSVRHGCDFGTADHGVVRPSRLACMVMRMIEQQPHVRVCPATSACRAGRRSPRALSLLHHVSVVWRQRHARGLSARASRTKAGFAAERCNNATSSLCADRRRKSLLWSCLAVRAPTLRWTP
eukprot:scaffold1504_cov417-Prasinococcus_capsulatus_cf.AAC.44